MIDWDETTSAILKRFRFDPSVSQRMSAALAGGHGSDGDGRLPGGVTPPELADLTELPPSGSPEGETLATLGRAAVARGEVGVVVLAGGMATRFGGVVKATVEVMPGYSFLRLKLAGIASAAARGQGRIPVLLLTSFATTDEIRSAVRDLGSERTPIQILEQSVTVRLTSSGDVFRDAEGRPSLCATGHGDLLPSLRATGALAAFRETGGKLLMVSNVDNLAATLDPRVIGAHLRGGKAISVEVVRKSPGDRGGIPARVNGHLQIVEEFRLPQGFDGSQVPFFNTNTFLLDAAAIDREFDLDWFRVRRKVDGQESVQAERLLGQVTAFLPTQFLVVERQGRDGRFLPVKDRQELQSRMADIQALAKALGID
jgi:UTP--glucose-1-phosphate uridylyltransferase